MNLQELIKKLNNILNNGKWNGKQILSENWVNETMKTQILQDRGCSTNGYSYLFWTQTSKIKNDSFDLIIARGNMVDKGFL